MTDVIKRAFRSHFISSGFKYLIIELCNIQVFPIPKLSDSYGENQINYE